jgi:hypothetical protein
MLISLLKLLKIYRFQRVVRRKAAIMLSFLMLLLLLLILLHVPSLLLTHTYQALLPISLPYPLAIAAGVSAQLRLHCYGVSAELVASLT